MSVDARGTLDEPAFVVGSLLGVLAFALGLAVLVLALSVGMRRGTYLTETQDLAIGVLGLVAIVGAFGLRMAAGRFTDRTKGLVRRAGTAVGSIGLMLVLFAVSAETTVSAPFLISPMDKAILFAVAYVLLVGGYFLLRGAGRMVGW